VQRPQAQLAVDSILEFKIVINSYSAEHGRSAAGQVNVITKSESNRFEFSAYENFHCRALNARNAFDTEGEEPPFELKQFGVSVGGPLCCNRRFAFTSIDFLRERTTVTRLSTVPKDLQRGCLSFTLQSKSDNTLRLRTTGYGAYAQAEWRLGRDVTTSLGLRYEYYTPPVDPTNHMSAFDPDTNAALER
jgi:outer membrane receptor protein involved in Fe transport